MEKKVFYETELNIKSIQEYWANFKKILLPISNKLKVILDKPYDITKNDKLTAINYIIWQLILNSIEANWNNIYLRLEKKENNLIIKLKDNWDWINAQSTEEKNKHNTLYENQWIWIDTFKMYAYWKDDTKWMKWNFKMNRTENNWTKTVIKINLDNLQKYLLKISK